MKGDCDRILDGHWHFDSRIMILIRWKEKAGLERDLLSSVPLWISFPALPLRLWSQQIIKAASLVGRPLYMDRATTRGERLAYARCFVEVAATQAMPCKIILENAERDLELLMLSTNGYPLVKHV